LTGYRQSQGGIIEMAIAPFVALLIVVTVLVLLDLVAVTFGVDSREGMIDDHRR
jgi:hypothetical protein